MKTMIAVAAAALFLGVSGMVGSAPSFACGDNVNQTSVGYGSSGYGRGYIVAGRGYGYYGLRRYRVRHGYYGFRRYQARHGYHAVRRYHVARHVPRVSHYGRRR